MQCPKVRWRQCEACQQRIQEEGLEDEFHLQSWFVGRINTFLKAQGRILIGWDEILEGGLSPGAVVMSWRVSASNLAACTVIDKVAGFEVKCSDSVFTIDLVFTCLPTNSEVHGAGSECSILFEAFRNTFLLC